MNMYIEKGAALNRLKSIYIQLNPGSSVQNRMGVNMHKQYAVIIHVLHLSVFLLEKFARGQKWANTV